MKSTLKTLAVAAVSLIALAAAAAFTITTVVDPNDYKPQIEQMAKQQGYPIALEGDLSWRFFPRLGIAMGHAKLLGASDNDPPLAAIEQVNASVMVLPLLNKNVVVDQILLEGVSANLHLDRQGNSNWQHLSQTDGQTSPVEAQPAGGKSQALKFAANSIHLKDASVRFVDQQTDTDLRLDTVNLEINRLNLEGLEFPLRLEWAAQVNHGALKQTLTNNGAIEAALTLSPDFSQLIIDHGHLNMEVGNSDVLAQSLVQIAFSATLDQLNSQPTLQADFALTPTDLKAIANNFTEQPLQTQNPKALTHVGLNFSARSSLHNLQIDPLHIQLDNTEITGQAQLLDQNQIQLKLAGGAINLDDYLPDANAPPAEMPAEPNTNGESDDLKLAVLHDFIGNLDVAFEQISAFGIKLEQPRINAMLANAVLQINPIQARIQNKTARLKGRIDAEGKLAGELNVPTINLRQLFTDLSIELPVTSDNSTLQALDLSLKARGDLDDIEINELSFGLDQTRITGSARIRNGGELDITLAGTELDADRYLPPPAVEPATSDADAPPTPTEPAPETPLDFSALQNLTAKAALSFNRLKANNLELTNLKLTANSNQGLAKLDHLSADFYQGQLKAKGQLDARKQTPALSFTGNGQGVAIKPLLAALAADSTPQKFVLAGLANGKVELNTQGHTVSGLVDNAQANISANTQSLQLVPINIEKMVCQAVALVQGESLANIDWPALTQMQDLNAKIRYANQTATIEQLSAGVEQFNLGALGKVDLGKQSLDVQLPVQFSQPLTQRQGCPATSSWLVGKALSLVRCKGSLLEPTQACGLDDRAIREAVKDYAEAKAKAKVDAKKDEAKQRLDEKKDRLKDKIDDELGEGTSELLKDLFKRD